jgi:hypothetical protein
MTPKLFEWLLQTDEELLKEIEENGFDPLPFKPEPMPEVSSDSQNSFSSNLSCSLPKSNESDDLNLSSQVNKRAGKMNCMTIVTKEGNEISYDLNKEDMFYNEEIIETIFHSKDISFITGGNKPTLEKKSQSEIKDFFDDFVKETIEKIKEF